MSNAESPSPPRLTSLTLPFTLYDLFGYLLPGLVFWMALVLCFDASHLFWDLIQRTRPIWRGTESLKVFQTVEGVLKTAPMFVSASALLIAYISGHLISSIASFVGERFMVEWILGYPGQTMFGEAPSRGVSLAARWLLHRLFIFRKFVRPYSIPFRAQFAHCFATKFRVASPEASDRFWLCFSYVAHNCPMAFARCMHFLNLYAFNRNLSIALVLAGIVAWILLSLRNYPFPWLIPVALFFASVPLYWNFLKLLRRLNDETFRTFVMHSSETLEPRRVV